MTRNPLRMYRCGERLVTDTLSDDDRFSLGESELFLNYYCMASFDYRAHYYAAGMVHDTA